MADDTERTVIRQLRSVLQREKYEGDRRSPPPVNWLAYLPLALAVLAGVAGYVRMESTVAEQGRMIERVEATHDKDMSAYQSWNKSISERLRHLERGE